jgi:hypothetical protein
MRPRITPIAVTTSATSRRRMSAASIPLRTAAPIASTTGKASGSHFSRPGAA